MAKKGRPTKLTQKLANEISETVRQGNYMETAAAYHGISKTLLYEWLKAGNRNESTLHVYFLNALQQAMADSEMHDLGKIGEASEGGDWKASAWRLERKFPKRWGRKSIHRIEDEGTETNEQKDDAADSAFNEETAHSILLEAVKRHRKDNGDGQFED